MSFRFLKKDFLNVLCQNNTEAFISTLSVKDVIAKKLTGIQNCNSIVLHLLVLKMLEIPYNLTIAIEIFGNIYSHPNVRTAFISG